MANLKFLKSGETLYFKKSVRLLGQDYSKGDIYPEGISEKLTKKLFQAGTIAHEESFRYNKNLLKGSNLENKNREAAEEVSREEKEGQPVSEEDRAVIVEDTDESFKVKYKGVVKEIKRNQIREDGTLTAGGLKNFEE